MKKTSLFIIAALIFSFSFFAKTAHATWTYYGHSMPYVVAPENQQIAVTLTANPSSLTLPANSSTLTWTTTGTPDTCHAANAWNGTKNAAGGTQQVTGLTAGTYVYEITCERAGFTQASASAMIIVSDAQTITATLVANPTTIQSGQSSTLTWTSTNATACSGTNFATGGQTAGTLSVSPATTTTYTVTCTGAAGSASATATVNVVAPQEVTINYFQPKNSCLPTNGSQYPQFTWRAEGATSCTITRQSDGQSVTVGPSAEQSGGILAADGLYYKTILLALMGSPTTYKLQCSNQSYSSTATSPVSVCSNDPDFSLSATPSSKTLVNSAATFTVSANPLTGFSGPITLSATSSSLPAGTTYDFAPPALSCTTSSCSTSELTVTTPGVLTSGSFAVVITGTNGSLSHTAMVTINATKKNKPKIREL